MMNHLFTLLLAAFCLTAVGQVPNYVPTDGLIGWWPLNGNATDESGNGHDGDSSGPVPVEDRYGNDSGALEFDDGDFISLPTLTEHIPALSVAFWLKLDDYASGESPVGYNHFFNKWTDGSDDIAFVMSANTTGLYLYSGSTLYQSDVLPSLGEWQHVAFVIAPPYAAIYLDGTVVQTFENVNAMGQVPEQFMQIGGNGNIPGYNSVDGSMDEVGLWNRALTAEEVEAIYQSEPVSEVPEYVSNDGLVAWYSFDSNLDDAGPNNHDGQSDSFGFGEDAVGEAESSLRLELGEFVSLGMEDKLLNNGEDTLSISFWSKPDQGAFTTVSKYVNFEPEQSSWMVFDIESSGVRALGNGFDLNDVSWFSNCPNVTSGWSHVAAIYTPGTVSLWINGEFTCETNVPISNVTDAQPILVGRSNCDGDNCNDASGLIDNLGFWDRALTPEEIQALFDTEPIEQASQYVPDSVLVSEGWSLVLEREGQQYWLFDEDREWEEARAMCEALGAYLYWPNSLEEHEAVWESVPKGNDDIHYWTAIHQDFSTVECSDPNGGWSGPNGEPQTFFLWAPGEPSDANNKESVVQFEWDIQGNQWNDAPGQACDDGNNCACRFSRVILERANDLGCTDASACNYDEAASLDDGSCDYSCCPGPGCCHAGTVWDVALQQCVVAEPAYLNEPGEAAVLNPCYFDSDDDGLVDVNDLMNLLTVYNLASGNAPETTASWQCGDPLEYQGYDYETVQIGEQCWFAENARYLPFVSPSDLGWEDDGGAHAYVAGYEGTSVEEAKTQSEYAEYGTLYNFVSVQESLMCPQGWHVPSLSEWDVLKGSIGISSAYKLKSAPPVWDGTNELGFNAIRVPVRTSNGSFTDYSKADFWTSTSIEESDNAWGQELNTGDDTFTDDPNGKGSGNPIRCIKDTE